MNSQFDLNYINTLAKAIRSLSMDAVEKAKSGHPGLPLGCAELGATIFSSILKHNPKNAQWINRDRFVLSAGHGSMLLYSLLHLFGYGLSLDDLKSFRQKDSLTPGHPEFGLTNGVEVSTGPLGAGFANAVGMAMAEAHLGAMFNTAETRPIDHYTFVIAGDGCLMEGVSAEAASLAGHLGLGKLIVYYDSNKISIEGSTDIAFTEHVGKRFESYNWQVLGGDAYDPALIYELTSRAKQETTKPSLIILRSIIGKGSPNKEGSHEVHGSPLGVEEIAKAKHALGLDPKADFAVPPELEALTRQKRSELENAQKEWERLLLKWREQNPKLALIWDQVFGKDHAVAIEFPPFAIGQSISTRAASGMCLQSIAKTLPWLIGGSADLAPSNNTELKGFGEFQRGSYHGRNIHFGVREHAMGNIVNGIVVHGGLRAFGATFLVFADYMKPSLRLAALMGLPSIFVCTHDSIWVGEDGPTHQPIEQIEMLRSVPGLEVLRPADAQETALCWGLSLKKGLGTPCHGPVNQSLMPTKGPTALLLSRQNLTVFSKPSNWQELASDYGCYPVELNHEEGIGNPSTTLVLFATGSEVGLGIEVAQILAKEGIVTRVYSVPSQERLMRAIEMRSTPKQWELDYALKHQKAFALEAGSPRSWASVVGYLNSIGIEGFGRSGPGKEIAAYLGLDPESVAKRIKACL